MKIKIEPYNRAWASQFLQIKNELNRLLGHLQPQIEHFGSTSVPGLAAKPIIDIMVGLQNIRDLDLVLKPLMDAGFIYYEIYNVVMPNRRFFVKLKDNAAAKFPKLFANGDEIPHEELHKYKLAHIHIWELGSTEWLRHIAFREYLKTYPEIRQQYEDLKWQLSKKDWVDGNEYNDGKDRFIKTMEAKALTWYQNQNSFPAG